MIAAGHVYQRLVNRPTSHMAKIWPALIIEVVDSKRNLYGRETMKFYTLAGMAELFQTDESSILALSRDGDIPEPRFIGKRLVRWSEYDLEKWAAGGCQHVEPTIGRDGWYRLRNEIRREYLEKNLAIEHAVAGPSRQDKTGQYTAVAVSRRE